MPPAGAAPVIAEPSASGVAVRGSTSPAGYPLRRARRGQVSSVNLSTAPLPAAAPLGAIAVKVLDARSQASRLARSAVLGGIA